MKLGDAVMARLDAFAGFTEQPGMMTRRYLTPEHRAAADQLARWMAAAGMSVTEDAAATIIGRYEGQTPGLPALLLGSHIDTVRNAGKYDGNFGVLAALAAVEILHERGERLPFAIEVLGFGDEEGVRFPVTLTGSRAIAGLVDPASLEQRDADGISLAEALRAFGADPDAMAGAAKRQQDVLAYVELHIEQGPVLEAAGLPVGIVTAINGATRLKVDLTGMAGHAGTVPMGLRRDALAAAAEMMVAIERIGAAVPDLVATIGRIEVLPGAVNVIPGAASFTIDIRAPQDVVRLDAVAAITAGLTEIAARRMIGLGITRIHEAGASACAPDLIRQLSAAVARAGIPPTLLPSGAGHDAMVLGDLAPIGMLFLRCAGGISHNPAEAITAEDAGIAIDILLDFLRSFVPRPIVSGNSS